MAEGRRVVLTLRQGLVVTAMVLVAGGAALRMSAPEPERVAAVGAEAALRQVATVRVRAIAIPSTAEISGMLEARRSVELFSETRGPILEKGAEELDRVEAGQMLLQVDPLLAEVAVERAEAAVTRSRSQLGLAKSNLDRRRSLSEQGVASDADLEDAVNAERVAAAALRESRAELKRARDELAKKTVKAPFDGVLRSFPVEFGEFLQEGQQLGELLDLASARASIGLSDRAIVRMRPGQPVKVRVQAYPGEEFGGEILRVGAAADPVSKKFPVEIELANPDSRLLPGMVITVSFDVGESVPRTLVPRDATTEEFGLRFVYVIDAGGDGAPAVARRRRIGVRPLPFRPGLFEVLSGLEEGEEIALTRVGELRDGERVRRVQAGPS